MVTGEDSSGSKDYKQSIKITVDEQGNLFVEAFNKEGQPLTFQEQRAILHRVIDLVNDNLMAVFVQAYLEKKMALRVQQNGFRPTKVLDFLKGK